MRATDSPLPSERRTTIRCEKTSCLTQVSQASARPSLRTNGLLGLLCIGLACWALACGGAGGGSVADTGGVSGTGISQGSISAFGSIFVNGVEWDLDGAAIRIDDAEVSESDLRLGMVVRVKGDFSDDGLTGSALSVDFDAEIEGPIASDPVPTPGVPTQKTFEVLGRTIRVDQNTTVFDDGASFEGLVRDQVVEVSGFVDDTGTIRATRVQLEGLFPSVNEVELRGSVENLMTNPDGSGLFDLGPITVRFDSTTDFSGVTPQTLTDGDFVEVEGTLPVTDDEIDADEIKLEDDGFGDDDFEQAELEGIVTDFVSLADDFRVAGILTNASNAILDPPGATIANGSLVEVDGQFENGVLIASEIEIEDDDDDDDGDDDDPQSVQIEAAVSSLDAAARTLTILEIQVETDGDTLLEDDRDELPNFRFEDIQPGDWLEIEGLRTGPATVVARSIERDDDGDDVRLEGPVTSLNRVASIVAVVDQPVPIFSGTLYFDDQGALRTEEEFFRNPGVLMSTDRVRVTDREAADPELLGNADEVAITND